MDVSLSPEMEQLVRQKVESGRYSSASAVVDEALQLLKAQDESRRARLKELRGELQVGIEQLEQGHSSTYDEQSLSSMVRDVQATGRRKAAQELTREAQTLAAKQELDAGLLEGLDSGPATPMTREDWDELKRRVWEREQSQQKIAPDTSPKQSPPGFLRHLEETGPPVVLVINGDAEFVVQDATSHRMLLNLVDRLETIEAIRQGMKEIHDGNGLSLEQVKDEIRCKYGLSL